MHHRKVDVFQKLYEKSFETKLYKQTDPRLIKEREHERNCTFQPVIKGDSPFISAKTLRRSVVLGDENVLKRNNRVSSSSSKSSPFKYRKQRSSDPPKTVHGGLYTKSSGLQKIPPPSAGILLFYFNSSHPPSFENGSYLDETTITTSTIKPSISSEPDDNYEEVEVEEEIEEPVEVNTINQDGKIKPPPLPNWAHGTDGDPTRLGAKTNKKPLVIGKKSGEKKDGAPPPPTGWQAVLAEMERKKAAKSGLKKVDGEVIEKQKPLPNKKHATKNGKRVFKDHMEELSYKLAKMRGDIVDDDEEDEVKIPETTSSVKPIVSESSDGDGAKMVSTSSVDSKVASAIESSPPEGKPDLTNLKNLFASKGKPPDEQPSSTIDRSLAEGKPDLKNLKNLFAFKIKPPDEKPTTIIENTPAEGKPDLTNLKNLFASKGKVSDDKPTSTIDNISAEGKPDLTNLINLFAQKTTPPVDAVSITNAPEPSVSNPSKNTTTSSVTSDVHKVGTTNMSSSSSISNNGPIPFPPPLPRLWPPTDYYFPPPPSAIPAHPPSTSSKSSHTMKKVIKIVKKRVKKPSMESSSSSKVSTTIEMQRITRQLPDGYYMAEPVKGMVLPEQIIPGGLTTLALCATIQKAYTMLQFNHGSSVSEASNGSPDRIQPNQSVLSNKLTIEDLPLPSDFHASIVRGHRALEMREVKRQKEKELRFRSYLDDDRIPNINEPDRVNLSMFETHQPFLSHYTTPNAKKRGPPPSTSATAVSSSSQTKAKKDLTVPHDFISNVDKHLEKKTFSFRQANKVANHIEDPIIHSERTDPPIPLRLPSGVQNASIYTIKHVDLGSAYWVTQLHSDKQETVNSTKPLASVSEKGFKESSSTQPEKVKTINTLSSSTFEGMTTNRTGGDSGSSVERSRPFRHVTKGAAPNLRTEAIADKRLTLRQERKRQEELAALELTERKKAAKEYLRVQAMNTAMSAGVYKSQPLLHHHQKLIEKYATNPKVGIDLAAVTMKAYMDYSVHHLDPSNQSFSNPPPGAYPQHMYNNDIILNRHPGLSSHAAPPSPPSFQSPDELYRNLRSEFYENNIMHGAPPFDIRNSLQYQP